MKKLFLVSLFLAVLLGFSSSVFALITTENVDKDTFQYEVPYKFATADLAASQTAKEMTVNIETANQSFYYTVPRDGRLVGISVAGSAACTAGAATFDVTINNNVTGVQSIIEVSPIRTALGISGKSGATYAYMRQDRAETNSAIGFKSTSGRVAEYHNADNPYGRATPIVAGDRIGVKVTTSSGFAPVSTDYVVVVYVLE